ncbi:MAG: PepSY domain-containing protein [Pseudomonadota bacterium]
MRTLTIVTAIALGAFIAPSFAQGNRPDGGDRQWLSIPQIHARLEATGYRNIEKIEREHGSYEVKATDRNGARIKLYLNPQTGEVIDPQRREARRDRSDFANGQRNSADCNKRRCRDDLPQPGIATPPTGK